PARREPGMGDGCPTLPMCRQPRVWDRIRASASAQPRLDIGCGVGWPESEPQLLGGRRVPAEDLRIDREFVALPGSHYGREIEQGVAGRHHVADDRVVAQCHERSREIPLLRYEFVDARYQGRSKAFMFPVAFRAHDASCVPQADDARYAAYGSH